MATKEKPKAAPTVEKAKPVTKPTKPVTRKAISATASSKILVTFNTAPNLELPKEPMEFASRKRFRKWLRKKGLSIKNFDVTTDQNQLYLSTPVIEAPAPTKA